MGGKYDEFKDSWREMYEGGLTPIEISRAHEERFGAKIDEETIRRIVDGRTKERCREYFKKKDTERKGILKKDLRYIIFCLKSGERPDPLSRETNLPKSYIEVLNQMLENKKILRKPKHEWPTKWLKVAFLVGVDELRRNFNVPLRKTIDEKLRQYLIKNNYAALCIELRNKFGRSIYGSICRTDDIETMYFTRGGKKITFAYMVGHKDEAVVMMKRFAEENGGAYEIPEDLNPKNGLDQETQKSAETKIDFVDCDLKSELPYIKKTLSEYFLNNKNDHGKTRKIIDYRLFDSDICDYLSQDARLRKMFGDGWLDESKKRLIVSSLTNDGWEGNSSKGYKLLT